MQKYRKYWPFLVCGIGAPILTRALLRWWPQPYAVALANFALWSAGIWLFELAAGRSERSVLGALGVGAAAGLAAGLAASLLEVVIP